MALTNEFSKSSYSDIDPASGTHCLEVRTDADAVLIRDSKYPDGDILELSVPEYTKFIGFIAANEFILEETVV